MLPDLKNRSVLDLASKCADRHISAAGFLNLYKEFINERFHIVTLEGEDNTAKNNEGKDDIPLNSNSQSDAEMHTTNKSDNGSNRVESKEKLITSNQITEVYNSLTDDFIKLLNINKPLLLADYIVEVLFVNYDTDLIKIMLPKLTSVTSKPMLIHFFSKTCSFFAKLKDKLVIDRVNKDMTTVIIPNILRINVLANNATSEDKDHYSSQLTLAIAKLLQALLKFPTETMLIDSNNNCKENLNSLLSHLFKINKLLHKKLMHLLDSKVILKDSNISKNDNTSNNMNSSISNANQHTTFPLQHHDFVSSPSISSPQFISSPLSLMKTPGSAINSNITNPISSNKYRDMKLLRYYKNIWLNSKIMSWEVINSDFLEKYNSISSYIFHDTTNNSISQNFDNLLTDLIETSFTCFAQYLSNKQYHRTNCTLNVLERQWIIFISKHLPLLILKHSSRNPQVVTNALDEIDTKVVKVIKSYYSEKEDTRNRNEDLFDDFSTTSFDIRHDFIKSLIMLGLQPPSLINDFLREDQFIDPTTLTTSDILIIATSPDSEETINDIPEFLKSSLDSLELETINNSAFDSFNGIYQALINFENIAPTKQNELSIAIGNLLEESAEICNHARISKLCGLLVFNFSHSLTSIFTFYSPKVIVEILMKFIDTEWMKSAKLKKEDGDDSDETNELSLSFSWAMLLLITIHKKYEISLLNVAINSSVINMKDSFSLKFISQIAEIPDEYSIDENNKADPEVQTQSHKLVQGWLSDLFINGSLSDQLTQNTNTKQLSTLLPFICKQVFYALELNAITDINNAIGGFEYFLQPFMIVGLIKIMFWLEQYLIYLRNGPEASQLLQKVFSILNALFNPNTLNEDSRTFHNATLRVNAIPLLHILRKFRGEQQQQQSQSTYGVYSSDSQDQSVLDSLINKLTAVINLSPVYNMDPRIVSTDNIFSQQKPVCYSKLLILNENPIDKILTNQINSFWNLHSSTYYNLDFLYEIINLITPKRFLSDVLQTLNYKLTTYGVPAVRNKMATIESDHVLDYFLYFLILHDCESQWDATNMINLLSDDEDYNGADKVKEEPIKTEEPAQKQETVNDDDFDMLFGENDTSTHAGEDEQLNVNMESKDEKTELNKFSVLKRNSFGIILYDLKLLQDSAYRSGEIERDQYDVFNKIYEKYLHLLKTCIF